MKAPKMGEFPRRAGDGGHVMWLPKKKLPSMKSTHATGTVSDTYKLSSPEGRFSVKAIDMCQNWMYVPRTMAAHSATR